MVNSKEVFGTGPDNIKAAVERVLEIVKVTVGELAKSLPNNSRALAMALWVTVTGAVTSCNSQTPSVNHAPEADITELVEFVQAGELRMPISDLLQMFGVEDPDGDTLSVEVISGPASIEDGYLIVNAGEDVEVKLKVSDGKWWELELTLRFDVNHPPEVQNDTVSATASLPEWADSFTMSWQYILNQAQPRDPDGDPLEYEIINLVWATGYNLNEEWGYLEITWVSGGVDKVEFDVVVRDPNGDEVTIHVIVNISWEAVDNPTQISDLSVSVLDRPVPNTDNAVYSWGQFEVSWTLSDPDGLPSNVTLTLVGAGVSYPVTVNPDGTFSVVVDATWLPVGEYSLKFSGQDASGNLFEITVEVVKVYPWTNIVYSEIKKERQNWTGSFKDFKWNIDMWMADEASDNLYLWLEGVPEWAEVQVVVTPAGGGNSLAFTLIVWAWGEIAIPMDSVFIGTWGGDVPYLVSVSYIWYWSNEVDTVDPIGAGY